MKRVGAVLVLSILTTILSLGQEIGTRTHHSSGLGGFDKGSIEKPGPMHVPMLKLRGNIVSFHKLGFTVKNQHGQETVFLCCDQNAQLEAKKNTPLSLNRRLAISDFKIGDEVDVYYESLHNIVSKLRLVKRPQA